jgi:hypothetical protein
MATESALNVGEVHDTPSGTDAEVRETHHRFESSFTMENDMRIRLSGKDGILPLSMQLQCDELSHAASVTKHRCLFAKYVGYMLLEVLQVLALSVDI